MSNEPWQTHTLCCIIVNTGHNVLRKPFQLSVPLDSQCDRIFGLLKLFVPALRNIPNTRFRFHYPLVLISSQFSAIKLTREQVNLGECVERFDLPVISNRTLKHPPDVNAIISISETLTCSGQNHFIFLLTKSLILSLDQLTILSPQARDGLSSLVTIHLPENMDISQVEEPMVKTNGITRVSPHEAQPTFVHEFDTKLRGKRYIDLEVSLV